MDSGDSMYFDKDVYRRLDHAQEQARALIDDSSAAVKSLGVLCRGVVSEDRLTVTFEAVVPDGVSLDMGKWSLDLGDFLFNARATLDNLMWALAHDPSTAPLTEEEERQLYFPIAATEAAWRSFTGSPAARKLDTTVLERLRLAQPFVRPDKAASRGMRMMNVIHRSDKHRVPLLLALRADTQLPLPFGARPLEPGEFEWWSDELQYDEPIRNRLPLYRTRLNKAVEPPEDRTLHLIPIASFEGETYDIQDFVWDIEAALLRAVDTVSFGSSLRADVFDGLVDWKREALAALRRSLADGTNEWEERGFNLPSPFEEIIAEMNAPEPDLSRFTVDHFGPEGQTVWVSTGHPYIANRRSGG